MTIHALIFDITPPNGHSRELIAWLDEHGNGKFCRPAHPDKTLLDVRAGDVIVHRGWGGRGLW